ncbi:hypothetical protein ABBQ32_013473 [Trebouxia sp. C0010 RCD-2024]
MPAALNPASLSNILGKGPSAPRIQEFYTLGPVLGKGAFGTVYQAIDKKTGVVYACKSISKAKLVCKEDVEDVQREVEVLHLVSDHPNIALLVGAFEDKSHVHLVLEVCNGGELFDRIVSKGNLSERQAAEYFRTMVQVAAHCHQLGVMHRDIKPENFLLTDKTESAVIKAADFGLCTYFKPGQRFRHIVGSAYYVAPEVLQKNYSHEADMWSLGVVLYILLCGLPPFWGDTEEEIFKMVLKSDLDFSTAPWPSVSDAAKDCVKRLLNRNAGQRATAAEVLQHPWLTQQGLQSDRPLDNVVIQRMRQFAGMTKLKKAAFLVVARCLSSEEISGLRQLFQSIDTDHSGTITVDELKVAMKNMGNKLREDELRELLATADVDGNGTIDYEEFVAATVNLNKLEREEHCMQAFQHFDADHSGFITPDEVEKALKTLGGASSADAAEMVKQYDLNDDGQIDYNEFVAMLRKQDNSLQQASSFFKSLRVPDGVQAPA